MDNVILILVSKHEFRQFLDSSIRQILAEQLPIDKSSTAIPSEILFLDEACTSTRLAKPICICQNEGFHKLELCHCFRKFMDEIAKEKNKHLYSVKSV